MGTRRRQFVRVAALALAVAPLGGISVSAQMPSTFQMSCTHIGAAGSTLFAQCRRIDGSFNQSQIQIPGMENINGRLRFNGMGYRSTFQNSCTDITVTGATLSATCRRMDGGFTQTSIPIFGIENINGNLQYVR